MTFAAGFRCADGVVMCADTQQTIPDYLKMTVSKFATFIHEDAYRITVTGAGGENMIEMVYQTIVDRLVSDRDKWDYAFIENTIRDVIRETVLQHVLPFPVDERPWFQLLIAVQMKSGGVALLRTQDTTVSRIDSYACVGSVAFAHYGITDVDFRAHGVCVARPMAVQMLARVKDHDPNCGKKSEMAILYDDWTFHSPTQSYLAKLDALVRMVDTCASTVVRQGMMHRCPPKAVSNHAQHLEKHISMLQNFELNSCDEHCRLRPEYIAQMDPIPLLKGKSAAQP